MDIIEDASIEVDGGYGDEPPYQTRVILHLTGDFVTEFEDYLDNEHSTMISLQLPREVAEKLYKELGEALAIP